MDYSDVLENIKATYGEPVIGLLNRIKATCEAAGMTARGPYDMTDDDYRWSIVVYRPGKTAEEDLVDITVEIAEQRDYEGGEDFGLNFGLTIVEYGGRILGGYQPYNYTPDVWVDARDPGAVTERWQEFASADISEIPVLIMDGA